MSSFLNVAYGTRRFKVPVTPSTLLGQVRDEVCSSANGLGLNSAEWGLGRQGKQLDLTMQLRFANLVNNAQVDLLPLKTSSDAPVRVKVRVPNGNDFVGAFPSNTTVSEVTAAAGQAGASLKLGGSALIDPTAELRSLGGGAGGLLFTATRTSTAAPKGLKATHPSSFPSRKGPSVSHESSQSMVSTPAPAGRTTEKLPHRAREVVVVTGNGGTSLNDAEEPPEMGVSQFRSYHSHLKAQAEPAMISRETRERMRVEKRAQVEATKIRVKLPDQSFLEGSFQKGEHGEQVYAFVRSYLRAPRQLFELKSMNPAFTLIPGAHLMDDCHFGSRALLVFQWVGKPPSMSEPVLNDQAMAMAKPARNSEPEPPMRQPLTSSVQDPPQEVPKKKDSLKKVVPKWMRLHKG